MITRKILERERGKGHRDNCNVHSASMGQIPRSKERILDEKIWK